MATEKDLIEKLINGLEISKTIIRGWHGMKNVPQEAEEEMWNIYDKQSPEMKRLNALIEEAKNERETIERNSN